MLGKKQAFLDYDNIYFWMIAKLEFPMGLKPMILVWKFFNCFFLGRKGLEKLFGNVLCRKQGFFAYKNIDLWMVAKLVFFMILVKNWKLLITAIVSFWQRRSTKCSVMFYTQNMHFKTIKIWICQRSQTEIGIFQKGWTNGFFTKIEKLSSKNCFFLVKYCSI